MLIPSPNPVCVVTQERNALICLRRKKENKKPTSGESRSLLINRLVRIPRPNRSQPLGVPGGRANNHYLHCSTEDTCFSCQAPRPSRSPTLRRFLGPAHIAAGQSQPRPCLVGSSLPPLFPLSPSLSLCAPGKPSGSC